MVNLEINTKSFRLKDQWSDITLKEAIELYKLAQTLPESLISLYAEYLKEDIDQSKVTELKKAVTIEEQEKLIPEIYGKMIMLLGDVDEATMKKVWPGERKALYDRFISSLVVGLLHWPAYESKGLEYFEHQGEKFYLPSSSSLFGYERPGKDLTALEFTEVADLQIAAQHMQEGRYANASKIIAILCRPKGEAYDETTCGNRAEGFMELTMDKVWEVFFSLVESTVIFQQHSLLSTLQQDLLALLSGSKSKPTGGMPASSKLRKRARWGRLRKSKKQTHTTS